MRNALSLILGSALLAACSSSSEGTSGTTSTGTTTGAPALPAGQPCSSNTACASGICGIDGTGNCCLGPTACVSGDPTCGATACDDTGICIYPGPSKTCGTSTCQGTTFTPAGECNGQGLCHAATSSTCANDFGCAGAGADGGVCATTCASSAECAKGFVCNAGVCVSSVTLGPCTENDDCFSGTCGASGTGHCCTAACTSATPPCGATDCDATGACEYAASTVACGSLIKSCTGSTQQNPSLCDGAGSCDTTPGTTDCTPFLCGPTACLSTCTDDSSCGTGDFCDIADSACCEGLSGGADPAVIAVDSVNGIDSACCGIGSAKPCATIAKAMKLIDTAQAGNVTLTATVAGKGGDWAPSGEVYPIVLGWGVELEATGVYFNDTSGKPEIFDIARYSANDTLGTASILGAAGTPAFIGIDSKLATQTSDPSAIRVEAGNTLYLAGVTVNGNPAAGSGSNAITVVGGASLVLAQDSSGTRTGTVTIGGPQLPDGFNGIVCTSAKGLGCTITDAALAKGTSSVVIQNQEGVDLDAEDGASITLTSKPVIGIPPAQVGFETCASKKDSSILNTTAVLLNGSATLTFKNGTVSCISGGGFRLQSPPDGGSPSLTLDSSTVENTELGVYASAGTAAITHTTLQYNYNGAEQDSANGATGSIDLAGGGNTVICSNSAESALHGPPPGVCVLNTTGRTLDAANTSWDTSGPDLFQCDPTLTTCTCQIASCSAAPGADGMDAVYESTGDGGTIDTSGNALSNASCTVPPPPSCNPQTQAGCPPGDRCCNSLPGSGKPPYCSGGQFCPG